MKEIIAILNKTISDNIHSESRSHDIELLIKARAIEILRPMAESGIGFAMESIAKIASSTSGRQFDLSDSINKISHTIAMTFREKEEEE